ncbi:MAG: hypothetical protein AAFZ09_11385, partial [Pseudomonadota bacterium]
MQVHRALGIRLPDWKVEILGTDISERALNVAADGVYGDYSTRSIPVGVGASRRLSRRVMSR